MGYLRKHMEAGRLAYGEFRRAGVPIGSGAVESAIRRVINLRLKGPGLPWDKANAEGALVLRAAAVSGRWEEVLAGAREAMGQDRQVSWGWSSPDMVKKLQAGTPIKPPGAQGVSVTGTGEQAPRPRNGNAPPTCSRRSCRKSRKSCRTSSSRS